MAAADAPEPQQAGRVPADAVKTELAGEGGPKADFRQKGIALFIVKAVGVSENGGSFPRFCQQPLLQPPGVRREAGFVVLRAFSGAGEAALCAALQPVQGIAVIARLHQAAFQRLPQLLPAHVGIDPPGLGIGGKFVGTLPDDGEKHRGPVALQQRQGIHREAAAAIVKTEEDGLFRQGTAAEHIVQKHLRTDDRVALVPEESQIGFQFPGIDTVLPRIRFPHLVIHEDG